MVEKRIYQVWKGSNKFFLCGRLIFGPDVGSLLVTLFLIIAPVVIFCVYVGKNLLHKFPSYNSGIAVVVVAVVLTVYVLILLLLTSGRDPGIIPRNPHPPESDEYYDSGTSPAEWVGGQTPRLRFPRTKDVIVNGVTVKTKYCDTCMLYRPPRCSHCSICNNCVERFDHHCPWVGQCIGQRNYRFFFMFVSSATLLCIYVFAFSALYIKFIMDGGSGKGANQTVWQALVKSPASLILMIYSFVAVWFVGGLTLFHLYLISTNQTTYENFRYRYDKRANPYNLGIIHNFKEIFCMPGEPSRNSFRAKVHLDTSGQIIAYPQPMASAAKPGDETGIRSKHTWQAGDSEGTQEAQGRVTGGGDVGLEIKGGYEDAFTRAIGRPLPVEGVDGRGGSHPRRSSWGRKSGSWDITPDMMNFTSGHADVFRLNGGRNSPAERVQENPQK